MLKFDQQARGRSLYSYQRPSNTKLALGGEPLNYDNDNDDDKNDDFDDYNDDYDVCFQSIGPLGRCFLGQNVRLSVCLSVCLFTFEVHPPMASMLLSASMERCFVSRMRDFFIQKGLKLNRHLGCQ